MNVARVFIDRPVATVLLVVGIALFGLTAYRLLPVAALPEVDFPTIRVEANLPGASAETMAASVAGPLEKQFSYLQDLETMTSSNGQGSTGINLRFGLNRKIDSAAQDVQAAINVAQGDLPKDLPQPPYYFKFNPAGRPVLVIALQSDVLPMSKVTEIADSMVARKLATLPGVAQTWIADEQRYAVRIRVNPAALAARNIALEEVRKAIAAAGVERPKGSLGNATSSMTIDANDRLLSADGYRDIVVTYRNGAPVRLSDIGTIEDGIEQERVGGWQNGKPAIIIAVQRAVGANTIDLVDRVRAAIDGIRATLPPSITLTIAADRSETIRASIADVQFTLLLTIGLVVGVIFGFLRSISATLIPSIVIPLSLLGTFVAMYAAGFTLDNLSLMALTIAVGFVVDDAIVVIENIVRRMEDGESAHIAAIAGVRQVTFTIISMTLSLVAVFIPIIFMGGIVGRVLREFGLTVSVAIAVSAVVSLTLTPVMCARFLSIRRSARADHADRIPGLRTYDRTLRWAMRHHRVTFASLLATIGLTVWLYIDMPKGFLPAQDNGTLYGDIEAPEGTSYRAMRGLLLDVSAAIRADPAVYSVSSYSGDTENSGQIVVNLRPRTERDASSAAVIARLRPMLARIVGVNVYLVPSQDISTGVNASRAQYQYTLTSTDFTELKQWAATLSKRLEAVPGLADVNSDFDGGAPHLTVTVDRDRASRLGIQPELIDETLYDAFGGRQVATIFTDANQYRVILEVDPRFQGDASALDMIYLPGPGNTPVPLSAIAHFGERTAPLQINHLGQFPVVNVTFNLTPGTALGDAVKRIRAVEGEAGLPASVHSSFQGAASDFESSLQTQPYLLAATVIVLYIVLGILYESYLHPLTILSTVPSAGVGALLLLRALNLELSLIALIGIILLIGIVKKNAIMMVDFAILAQREEQLDPHEAIYRACLKRFRPIMMTTMAALFGSLPLAIGFGAGAELRRPLGCAIVGGLLLSQVLTLYTTPVVYLYLERLRRLVVRRPSMPPALVPSAGD